MGHPFVKLKPLAEATLESRLKAKKAGATSLQPYRQRPETCTALARRLVSGALGVKLPTAPEERENERRVLREAKGKSNSLTIQFYLYFTHISYTSHRTQTFSCQTARRGLGELEGLRAPSATSAFSAAF